MSLDDCGPLFHRDLARVLGLPDDASLDDTMAVVQRWKDTLLDLEDFASRLSASTEQGMLTNKISLGLYGPGEPTR